MSRLLSNLAEQKNLIDTFSFDDINSVYNNYEEALKSLKNETYSFIELISNNNLNYEMYINLNGKIITMTKSLLDFFDIKLENIKDKNIRDIGIIGNKFKYLDKWLLFLKIIRSEKELDDIIILNKIYSNEYISFLINYAYRYIDNNEYIVIKLNKIEIKDIYYDTKYIISLIRKNPISNIMLVDDKFEVLAISKKYEETLNSNYIDIKDGVICNFRNINLLKNKAAKFNTYINNDKNFNKYLVLHFDTCIDKNKYGKEFHFIYYVVPIYNCNINPRYYLIMKYLISDGNKIYEEDKKETK